MYPSMHQSQEYIYIYSLNNWGIINPHHIYHLIYPINIYFVYFISKTQVRRKFIGNLWRISYECYAIRRKFPRNRFVGKIWWISYGIFFISSEIRQKISDEFPTKHKPQIYTLNRLIFLGVRRYFVDYLWRMEFRWKFLGCFRRNTDEW